MTIKHESRFVPKRDSCFGPKRDSCFGPKRDSCFGPKGDSCFAPNVIKKQQTGFSIFCQPGSKETEPAIFENCAAAFLHTKNIQTDEIFWNKNRRNKLRRNRPPEKVFFENVIHVLTQNVNHVFGQNVNHVFGPNVNHVLGQTWITFWAKTWIMFWSKCLLCT